MTDSMKRFKDAFEMLADAHSRQEEDLDLYHLEPFSVTDLNGVALNDVYNLTSTRPKVYADRLIGMLSNSDVQPKVLHKGKADKVSAELEEKWLFLRNAIDSWLAVQKEPPLLTCLAGRAVLAGSVATVVYPYEEEGEMIPHVLPWDTQLVGYEIGRKGISIAGYKTTRSKQSILDEYQEEISEKTAEVVDIWLPDSHEVYVKGKLVKPDNTKHILKYVPVAINLCGSSAWHKTEGYLKYVGESCFGGIRDIIKGYNRLISILNTINMYSFTVAIQFANEQGGQGRLGVEPKEGNMLISTGLNDRFLTLPIPEIRQATLMLKEVLDAEWIYATLPLMEYGEMSNQETVAQITTKAAKTASAIKPFKKAIELQLDDIFTMLMNQLQNRGLPEKIRLKGKLTNIPKADWNDDCTIEHTLNIVSPQQNIANIALAQAMSSFVDLRYLLEHIIQVDDVKGVLDEKERQDVENIIPNLKALRVAQRLLDSKDKEEKAEGQEIAKIFIGTQESAIANGNGQRPPESESLIPLMKGR